MLGQGVVHREATTYLGEPACPGVSAAAVHIDGLNIGPSIAFAVGDFVGGDLVADGKRLGKKHKVMEFDGRTPHWVDGYSGHRNR